MKLLGIVTGFNQGEMNGVWAAAVRCHVVVGANTGGAREINLTVSGDAEDLVSVAAVIGSPGTIRLVGQCDKHQECIDDPMVGIGCWLDNVKGGKW